MKALFRSGNEPSNPTPPTASVTRVVAHRQGRGHVCRICDDVINLYRENASAYEIAERLSISSTTVYAILRWHEEPRRRKDVRPHRCHAECPQVIELYRSGKGVMPVAGAVGMSSPTVIAILRAHGETMRGRYDAARLRHERNISLPWHTEAVALFQTGMAPTAIAGKFNVTRERVRQVLLSNGISDPGANRPPRHRCGTPCRIVMEATPPVHILSLAKASGVSQSGLAYACQRHNIERNHEKRGHVCSDRCARLLERLKAGDSIRAAARLAGFKSAESVYGNMKAYHPDWPWPDSRWWLRPNANMHGRPHICDERCARALEARKNGATRYAASMIGWGSTGSGKLYDADFRRWHPDWPWPERKAT